MTTTSPRDDDLSDAEGQLMRKAVTGDLADVRAGKPELDNPSRGADWPHGRTVRADLLAAVLTGERDPEGGRLRAVRLRGARITGRLNLETATFKCPLALRDCHFDEPADFSDVSASSIRLTGSYLPGLIARQLRTTGDVFLDSGFTSDRGMTLSCAQIGGSLHLDGAHVTNAGDVPALTADRLTVSHNMFGNGFTAVGEVSLIGAHIGGDLRLQGANLTNEKGRALTADGLTVGQNVFCHEDSPAHGEAQYLTATGEIRLTGARISGDLHLQGANLTGAKLTNHDGADQYGPALNADGLTVGRNVFCRDAFTTCGVVRLTCAHIGGDLHLYKAKLADQTGPGQYGTALSARGLTVGQDMICQELDSHGCTDCSEAHIAGRLDLSSAMLANPGGVALNLDSATAAALILRTGHRPVGGVDLTNAKVGHFNDDPAGWPARIRLRGFTYDIVDNDRVKVGDRLDWLARDDDGYAPQAYDQLAAAYRNAGRRKDARRVGVARQWRCRRPFSPLNWLWYITVGYGYRTWLAAIWLVALVGFSTWIFSGAYPAHMVVVSPHPPAFHPVGYALDLLLPVISLGQKSSWQPQGSFYQYWTWAFTGLGWVLTTAVVAGLTGILKRD